MQSIAVEGAHNIREERSQISRQVLRNGPAAADVDGFCENSSSSPLRRTMLSPKYHLWRGSPGGRRNTRFAELDAIASHNNRKIPPGFSSTSLRVDPLAESEPVCSRTHSKIPAVGRSQCLQRRIVVLLDVGNDHLAWVADQKAIRHGTQPAPGRSRQQMMRHLLLEKIRFPPGMGPVNRATTFRQSVSRAR